MGKKEEIVDLNANNEEEWDKLKAHEGLIIVDIYSKWAGPCSVMKSIIFKIIIVVFKKLKLQQQSKLYTTIDEGVLCIENLLKTMQSFAHIWFEVLGGTIMWYGNSIWYVY